jgi:hypothetical protein
MASSKGKTIGLILLVIVVLFFLIRDASFLLAPFGFFPNVCKSIKHYLGMENGIHIWSGGMVNFPIIMIFSLILLAIWIMVIFWVYRDAEKRGLNGLLWALLVFIGNLIALIIYLIIRNEHPFPETKVDVINCPHCEKPISGGYTYCPHCGKSIRNLCPKCEKEVNKDWQVCPYCRTTLKK